MRYASLSANAQTRARLWWIACTTGASGLMHAATTSLRSELEFLDLTLDVSLAIVDGDVAVRLCGDLDPSDAVRLSSLFGLPLVDQAVHVMWTDADHELAPDTVPIRSMVDALRRMLATYAREAVARALIVVEAELASADAQFDQDGRLQQTGTIFESVSLLK